MTKNIKLTRRHMLAGMVASSALVGMPAFGKSVLKIGVMVPDSGPAGLFGPSCRNCAVLAIDELNANGGILRRTVEPVFADVGTPPAEAVNTALKLVASDRVEALVGMNDSAVRSAIAGALRGRVPYIYTPVYEGGECGNGMFVVGETPAQQLKPVIPYLARKKSVKKWYLIGNDYSWPRNTNVAAKQYIASTGGSVVGEEYLSFEVANFDASLQKIRASGADAVLITLVGGASVGFNIAFAQMGLDKQAIRLGTLIEENTLMGIGAANSNGLWASAGYFASISTPSNNAFVMQYNAKFGADAAPLNALGESVYEGILLLSALAEKSGSVSTPAFMANAEGTMFVGPRGSSVMHNRHVDQSIYLAEAQKGAFKVMTSFDTVDSGAMCSV